MAPTSSPTVKRRRLAAELRQRRLEAKLTIEAVAERLEWSPGKISKIENARVSVLPRDVRHLLREYGIEGADAEPLLTIARESRQRGWWQQYGDAIPPWFNTYVGLESDASTIYAYQGEYVPGLLQTSAYATAANRSALMTATEEEIEQVVKVRMERQSRLAETEPPQLWMVLNEAVIRRIVGDRATMHEQLTKLVEASERPRATIQILPFSAGAHPAMDSAFHLLGFDEPSADEIVYIEYPTGSIILENHEEVARYRLSFDHLRAQSLSADESRRMLNRAAEDLA